ncbi:MAG: hypothetical protein FWE95_00915 [Planctomycetaceae bacterium]|nr:hypothetical protein [Planctomycetaceae bacterium]
MYTLFKKEFHQHGAFAIAMICMCLLMQTAYSVMAHFTAVPLTGEAMLIIAIICTALYAGAATALAYSTEHADGTFVFLRKMPISLATLAGGKIGWALCGTLLVLIGNVSLAAVWLASLGGSDFDRIWLAWGLGIAEAFVWGLFWSTRCRSQVNALIAGYVCASVTASGITLLYYTFVASHESDTMLMYMTVAPYRCAAIVLVGLIALWGTFRWFHFETNVAADSRFSLQNLRLGYPQRVQYPFLALIHHHMRHASLIYHLGICCMVVAPLALLLYVVLDVVSDFHGVSGIDGMLQDYLFYIGLGAFVCVAGMVLFWSTIFGHDQKNDSYRFLSRIGIPEGAVWWSRMAPALFFYGLVIISLAFTMAVAFLSYVWRGGFSDYGLQRHTYEIVTALQASFTVWLIPMAVGAYISISLRSQMVAISLVPAAALTLIGWAYIGFVLFAASPLWTTVPICIALLVASRMRATYWLRETFSWRSRIIPLVPVFAILLAVMVALPLVRIYSVPYVSWQQIDAYFDQVDSARTQSPEKRKALLQYIAQHNAVPPEYETLYEEVRKNWFGMLEIGECTFEELLLLDYVRQRDILIQPIEAYDNGKKKTIYLTRYTPWETVRIERALRAQLVASLVATGGLQDRRAESIRVFCERQSEYSRLSYFDTQVWWNVHWSLPYQIEYRICTHRLITVSTAINRWYEEHDRTLPESLDALLERGYLAGIPVHPCTREEVEYYRNAPPPEGHHFHTEYWGAVPGGFRVSTLLLGRSSDAEPETDRWQKERDRVDTFRYHGGTYLLLGTSIIVLIEEERSQEEEETESLRKQGNGAAR